MATATATSLATRAFTSETFVSIERAWSWLIGDLSTVDFFHDPCAPHSHVTLHALREMRDRLSFNINVKIVKEQPGSYQTADRLSEWQWSLHDATLATSPYPHLQSCTRNFSQHHKQEFSTSKKNRAMLLAVSIVMQYKDDIDTCLSQLCALGEALFKGVVGDSFENGDIHTNTLPLTEAQHAVTVNETDLKRNHYLVGMTRRGRQWYWGVDRLGYLERELGLSPPKYTLNRLQPSRFPTSPIPKLAHIRVQIFFSFRSPYSQIVLQPLIELCHRTGAQIEVMAVLPMVMRGLEIPLAKRLYIIRDAAREARTTGQDNYFKVIDPVGRPVERAFVAYWLARESKKELDFVTSWAKLVWRDGVDARDDAGLKVVVEDAKLSWAKVARALDDPQVQEKWKSMAESNRALLYSLGLWGVPSFRVVNEQGVDVGGTAVWGQDRLFVIQKILEKLALGDVGESLAKI